MRRHSSEKNLKVLRELDAPWVIQEFLNGFDYDHADGCSSPVNVVRERKAHCLEGALLAAACLRFSGWEPLIVDLRAKGDDDHVLAVFKEDGMWGAVSKSSFITLEYREPVYRSLRELVMSYFDFYLNHPGHITLREYSRPLNLRIFDDREWVTAEGDVGFIGDHLDGARHYRLLSRKKESRLRKVDSALLEASLSARKRIARARKVC